MFVQNDKSKIISFNLIILLIIKIKRLSPEHLLYFLEATTDLSKTLNLFLKNENQDAFFHASIFRAFNIGIV
jgi:hypothetical protein